MAGDKVLVKNVRQENRKGGKMDPDILGPFTIINIEGKNDDVISTKGKKKLKFNIDHLIKYVEPEPQITKNGSHQPLSVLLLLQPILTLPNLHH